MGQNTPSACSSISIPGPPTWALGHRETSRAHTGPNLPGPDPELPSSPLPAQNKGDCSPRNALQADVHHPSPSPLALPLRSHL